MRIGLTDRFVASAKAAVRTDYFDAVARGLALRVTPSGAKSWSFHFTSPRDGKRARLTIGGYPGITLADARARALEAKALADTGEDPRNVFTTQAAGALTVAGLVDSFLDKHARPNLRSASEVERRLFKNVVPLIGSVKLADLHRRDINRVVDAIMRRGRATEANRVFEDLRGMLRWAVARGDLDSSPAQGMNKPAAPRIGERELSEAEIKTLWAGLPTALARSKDCQRIIRLCLITAQRVGEVAGMERVELDLAARLWSLPGSRTKNGHPHTVPLSELAIAIIREAVNGRAHYTPVFECNGEALSPHAVARTILRANAPDEERPLGRFGITPWSAHDLRRTALTGMARLGIAPIVLGHVANHRTTTKAGVTLAVYSKHEYDAEKRAALELWAAHLASIVRP